MECEQHLEVKRKSLRFLMLNWRDPENPKTGGAERVTLGYLAALAKRGHEVYWFAQEFENAKKESEIEGVRIVRGGTNIFNRLIKVITWYKKQPHFDLVIDQHHGVPWYAPWWCKTHCISYIHEVLGSIWQTFYKGIRAPEGYFGKLQEKFTLGTLYRNVPFWTACGSTAQTLERYGVKKIKRIPYGVDTLPLEILPQKTLKQDEVLRLVVVSRLAPNKRIDHAVRTFHEILKRGISTELKIVGDGESLPALRTLVADLNLLNSVKFLGFLDERKKDEYLRDAHFLMHTSVREGWGLNVIEANAMGTPAAVYPAEGLTESTLKNETGIISEQETPASLANEIIKHIGNQQFYNMIRENAWKRAGTFHWSRVLPIACDWLESVASKEH